MKTKTLFLMVSGETYAGRDPDLTEMAREKTRGLRVFLPSFSPPMYGGIALRHRRMATELGNTGVIICWPILGQARPMATCPTRKELEARLANVPHGAVVLTDSPVLKALGFVGGSPDVVYWTTVREDGHVTGILPMVIAILKKPPRRRRKKIPKA